MYLLAALLLFFAGNFSHSSKDPSLERLALVKIYAHCIPGSFAHQALNYLKQKEILFDEKVYLYSDAFHAMENAYKQDSYVFLNLSDGSTSSALKFYEIDFIDSVIQTKQEVCLFQHKQAVEKKIPVKQIASIPSKLKKLVKKKSKIKMIEVPAGMEEACKLLCSHQFSLSTAVLAPKIAGSVYKDLVLSPSSLILGVKSDFSFFALVKLKKREEVISEKKAKLSFQNIVKEIKKNLPDLHSIYQVSHFEEEKKLSKG